MADSGGYWLNLAEAQKLTQTMLIPGVIQENIRQGGILDMLPLTQVIGQSITWNRENAERLGSAAAIGDVLAWTDNITYSQQSRELTIIYDQTPLNHYVQEVYGSHNNYRATVLSGMVKGMVRKIEDLSIYGDVTYGTNEFDGLHAWAEENTGDLDIDEGEAALSLSNLRILEDAMQYGVDFYLISKALGRRFDSFYQEEGVAPANVSSMGSFVWGQNDAGKRTSFWNGVELKRSDYMVAEQANTGVGSDARAKQSSGTNQYSLIAVKLGQVREENPGMTMAFGGEKHDLGELLRLTVIPDLEDYDAEGLRLVSYLALIGGSSKSVGRIFDITDTPIQA